MKGKKGTVYKVTHKDFDDFKEVLEDLLRYSNAIILEQKNDYVVVEMSPSGDPRMNKAKRELDKAKWESHGYKLEKM